MQWEKLTGTSISETPSLLSSHIRIRHLENRSIDLNTICDQVVTLETVTNQSVSYIQTTTLNALSLDLTPTEGKPIVAARNTTFVD